MNRQDRTTSGIDDGLVSRRRALAALAAVPFAVAGCSRAETAGSEATAIAEPDPPATTASTRPTTSSASTDAAAATGSGVFALGVASGDPRQDSIVLWTRLAPDPLDPLGGLAGAGPIDITWELAAAPDFSSVVASGSETAEPEHAHSLRVVVNGLNAGTDYWYRFTSSGETSPTGHLRTIPADTARFRIASGTCQALYSGYYAAHRDLAQADVDLVLWLGDFIYEWSPPARGAARQHNSGECQSLDDYRQRYAQYRSDIDLQAASAAHAWMVLIDDHEIVNDVAGAELVPGPDRDRALAGLTAWWEHQPTRLPQPTAEALLDPMYQSVTIGDLARVSTLDTRTNRTPLPCGKDIIEQCDAAITSGELLGQRQRDWLDETLSTTDVTWDVVAQQVLLGGFDISETAEGVLVSTDTWDGYQDERRWLAERLEQQANPIVLSGDFHMAMVNEVRADPRDRSLPVSAIELMAPALTSEFRRFYSADSVERFEAAAPQNPQVRWSDYQRGYLVTTLERERLVAEFRFVDRVEDPSSSVRGGAVFEVRAGTRTVEQTS